MRTGRVLIEKIAREIEREKEGDEALTANMALL